jgi:acetoin utilization deacetylase AcuC-like enzyme
VKNEQLREQLAKYGLEDDCPLPTDTHSHALLWKYCLAVAEASCNAASLLVNQEADVSIHWGGGRHHAHRNKAGGFCYVNDIVLAIRKLLNGSKANSMSNGKSSIRRVLYVDLDIHHPDGVQAAFYSTDEVLTASFHRHEAGFYPASSGGVSEKGQLGTKGLGYNINVPLPAGIEDVAFLYMYQKLFFDLVSVYDPHAIVLCVDADGLNGDPLVNGEDSFDHANFATDENVEDGAPYYVKSESTCGSSGEGWSLSPECIAECVRIAAALCAGCDEEDICVRTNRVTDETSNGKPIAASRENLNPLISANNEPGADDLPNQVNATKLSTVGKENDSIEIVKAKGRRRKLLVLGGGGYSPSQTSRTWLLSTAAACEGARPGLFWHQLPKDIPNHVYFPRYGPTFELVSVEKISKFAEFYASSDQVDKVTSDLSDDDRKMLQKGIKAIELASLFIRRQRGKSAGTQTSTTDFSFETVLAQDEGLWAEPVRRKSKCSNNISRGCRKKVKRPS